MPRESNVIFVMRNFKEQLRSREAAQMAEMARAWRQVERDLEGDIEALARQVAELVERGETVSQARLMRLARYRSLLRQVIAGWDGYASLAARTIANGQAEWARLGILHGTQAINVMGAGVIAGFDILPVEAVANMVGLLGDGSPLASVLRDRAVSAQMVDSLTRKLLLGVARGWQPTKTAREMRDGLAGGLQKALTIARTEQMRAYREANRQQMAASGVVDGYYRLATRDDRVCAACLARDGEFYELGQPMAEHPQGRCAQVPAVRGVAPPQWLKGPQWFETQGEATQRSILGNKRYELWRDGAFELGAVSTVRRDGVWGDSVQVAPVAELAGG